MQNTRTSIYDTSTTKLIFGSASFFELTRTNNSEQVKGIIPLSGPSVNKFELVIMV